MVAQPARVRLPVDAEWEPRIKVLELEIEIKTKELQLHELRSTEVHGEDYDVPDPWDDY